MRNIIILFTFLFISASISAQETTQNFSFEFKDIPLKSVLLDIENASKYKFYFDENWFINDKTTINESFKDKSIETILNTVLDKSDLNFLVQKGKIILTKNKVIYDTLQENYFDSMPEKDISNFAEKPLFENQTDTTNIVKKENSTLLIGKQTKSLEKKALRLTGYLKNQKTGEPIANAYIKVQNKTSNTVSNEAGYYILEIQSGVNTIEIIASNFKNVVKKVVMYSNGTLDFKMNEEANQLKEVIVNSKRNENIKSAITGVTSIDIEGIKNIPMVLGERDILKVATILPGVKTTGEGSAGFNVRGGKEDQNLILLDHAIIYNPSHFFGFFSAVNPFTTKKANIYKGSIPAEFGGRLSSVFDITTKNGNPTKFSGEAGIGPVTSNISIGTPVIKDKSSLLIGARATYSGWILRSLNEDALKNSEASFYDGIIKYNHNFNENNSLETTVYYSRDVFSITSDSLFKYSNQLISLKYDHAFNAKNKGALILTNSQYKFNIDYQSKGLNSFDFGYKINETQVMLKMNYLLHEKHKINYGFSSKLYGINPGYLDPIKAESLLVHINIDKERGLESAIYLSDSFKVNEKLLIDIGLRYSSYSFLGKSSQRIYQENVPLNDATVVEIKEFKNNEIIKTYGGLEPRIAARYFLMDNFSVKASYDKANQYIHLLSSNTTQSPTDTWKLSDLNVKPQVAEQFSLGLYKNIEKGDLEVSVEGYYKKSNNFLDYKVGAQLLLNENIETELLQGKGKAYGIEVLLKKQSGKLNGWIGYTYSRTFIKLDSQFDEEKVNNGKFFPANFDKPHDVSVVMNYRLTKRYSLSSNFIYQTGRPITYPIGTYTYANSEYTLYSDRNKYRIPDYFRLDIGFNVEGNHKIKKLAHSFWNVSIYNVLGRNNPYSVYFVTEEGKIKAYQTSIFSIPIPTVTYNFKF